MTDARNGGPSASLVESIAGLSAGTVATLAVHPLDIVKTRMQIHRSSASPGASPPTTLSLLRTLLRSPQPVASLYRGLTPNLVGNATSWSVFFFFKSRAEEYLLSRKRALAPRDGAATQVSAGDNVVAATLAGVLTTLLTNPIFVLKTRMISSDRHSHGAYPSMISGAAHLFRTEGIAGFYRGAGVSLIGASHGAVQFGVYEPAKRLYLSRRQRQRGTDLDSRISNEATLVLSSMAKLVAGAVTYPYQVVRSRLQNYEAAERFGKGITGVVRKLWREEGPRGFYRGVVPGVIRVMPATWVTFLVYENVKFFLPRWLG